MLRTIIAARWARDFLRSARTADGYRLDGWPAPAGPQRPASGAAAAVARLRIMQRLLAGFLNPVDDALFLAAGLLRMGYPASFHLGRELAPASPPAGYYPWVQCGQQVLSTSLPVHDEYIEVYRCEPK